MVRNRPWGPGKIPQTLHIVRGLFVIVAVALLSGTFGVYSQTDTIIFNASGLIGESLNNPTSLQFGPDGRLYVSQQNGNIYAYNIMRNDPSEADADGNYYEAISTETIGLVQNFVPNHNDDGTPSTTSNRQITGILVAGTQAEPVLYVTSSDPRIGAGGGGTDKNLDTNSGVISRLTCVGGMDANNECAGWDKVDLIRGLPRSEENHSNNGMQLDPTANILYVAIGGHTNAGSPSNNFAFTTEYALSAAIISVNLDYIDAQPILEDDTLYNNYTYKWVYDLPTLDDPTRPNDVNGADPNDPFGGNDGLNQAKIVPGGPVQIFSPGWRNLYDLVITENGRMYGVDNGANGQWGGHPEGEADYPDEATIGACTNNYLAGEPGSTGQGPGGDAKVNNKNGLHFIRELQSGDYNFVAVGQPYYAGHPTPVRGNPVGAGLYTDGIFRSQILDENDANFATNSLPIDWPPVPANMAYPAECDFRNSGQDDGAIANYGPSTNGIAEYTASNFGGALQGDLLMAAFNGNIYQAKLNETGDVVTNCPAPLNDGTSTLSNCTYSFASGFGSSPLDVIAQGDLDVFAGTVWAATYGSNNITIFEPADYNGSDVPLCTGEYDDAIDEDGDGYTNADEMDNGTNPCSGASKPNDYDNVVEYPQSAPLFKRSDLNDSDDDNDTILDVDDSFALDATNGLSYSLPLTLELFNNEGYGFGSAGFTGMMTNGVTDYLNQADFVSDTLILGGTAGLVTIPDLTVGTVLAAANTQENAFQFGVNVGASDGVYVVRTRLEGPFATPTSTQSFGMQIGTGDQDNYLKLVLVDDGFEVVTEINGEVAIDHSYTETVNDWANVLGGVVVIDLFLEVDPLNATVTPYYTIGLDGIPTALAPVSVSGPLVDAIQGNHTINTLPSKLAVGLIGNSNEATEFSATWDLFYVLPAGAPQVAAPIPDQSYNLNLGTETVTLSDVFTDDFGINGLTYSASSSDESVVQTSLNNDVVTINLLSVGEANITVTATDASNQSSSDTFTVTVTDAPVVLYRVNTGGPQIAAEPIPWAEDQSASNANGFAELGIPSPYVQLGTGFDDITYGIGTVELDTTALGVPNTLFKTERYSDNTDNALGMQWDFPVDAAGTYVVRLYFAEIWTGAQNVGGRVFDVSIEGQPVLTNFDQIVDSGFQIPILKEFMVEVTDGNIDIDFGKVVQNPAIKAIEILGNGTPPPPPIVLSSIADQDNIEGDAVDFPVIATGGQGNLNYSIIGQPAGVQIEPTNGQIFGEIVSDAAVDSPYTVTVTVDDSDDVTDDAQSVIFNWVVTPPQVITTGEVLYRVNVGGGELAAADGSEPVWSPDTNSNPSLYWISGSNNTYNGNSNSAHTGDIVMGDPSIPPSAPAAMFNTERWDAPAAPNMVYQFPVDAGVEVEVRLYFAELYGEVLSPGVRVFDVSLEGAIPNAFNDIDPFAIAGAKGAFMRSETVVSDGMIDIEFIHGIENPAFKGIEIVVTDTPKVVTIVAPTEGETVIGNSVTVEWTSTGGDPTIPTDGDPTNIGEHVHVQLNDEAHIGSLPLNGSYTFDDMLPGNHTIIVTMADPYHTEYPETTKVVNFTVEELILVNNPPAITPVDDVMLDEGDTQGVAIIVTDDDDITDDTITVSVDVVDSNAAQLDTYTFDAQTGTLTLTPQAETAGSYTATITADDGVNDPVTTTFVITVDVPSLDPVVLSVDKQAPAYIQLGEQMTYNITVNNDGQVAAENVVITDTLPAGTVFVSATPEASSCVNDANTLTCALGTVDVSSTLVVEIVVAVTEATVVDLYTQTNSGIEPTPFMPQPTRTDLQFVEVVADATYDCGVGTLYNVEFVGCNNLIPANATWDVSVVYMAAEQPTELVNTAIVSADGIQPISDTVTTIIGEQPSLILAPDTFNFTLTEGVTDTQSVTLSTTDNSTPGNVAYTVIDNGTQAAATWVNSFDPISGVVVDTTGLTANTTYTATVTAEAAGYSLANATVSLTVESVLTDTGEALVQITPGAGLGASTYAGSSFQIQNLASSGADIESITFDLSTGILPDMVFDPVGAGGDATASCFTPNSGGTATGLVSPTDPCVDPFTQPRNGGFDVMTVNFSDFNPGESFFFTVDVDPNSIQGVPGAGNAGAVSGFELIGSTITIVYSDGTIISSLFDQGSMGGSQTLVKANAPIAPSISAVDVPTTPAIVNDPNQTITVTGTPGDGVTLLVMDTRLFIASGEAAFGVDQSELPFYANEAMAKTLYTATIGNDGSVGIPITLMTTDGGNTPDGGLNYLVAVADGDGNQTSMTSNVLVLKYEANTVPVVDLQGDSSIIAGETATVNVTATDDQTVTLTATVTDQNDVDVPGVVVTDNEDNTGVITIPTTSDDADDVYTVTVSANDGINPPTVETFTVTVLPELVTNPIAEIRILNGVNGWNDKSTYGNNSFYIENLGDVDITEVFFDVSTTYMPDVVFDPVAHGGDTVAKCFTANSGTSVVGLIAPGNACVDPFSLPNLDQQADDTDPDAGYFGLTIGFNDFNPTELFGFSIDMDPSSIKGDTTPGGSGGISGMEQIGGTVTVTFADGNIITAPIWLDATQSDAGGRAYVALNAPTIAPAINLVGINTPATTAAAEQVIEVNGPANAPFTLLQVDARLYIDAGSANGNWPNGYDIDLYEANESINKVIFTGTLDANGFAQVPVTLLQTPTPYGDGPSGGLNHFIAVVNGTSPQTSDASNVIVVEYDPSSGETNEAPIVTNPGTQNGEVGVATSLQIIATAPEEDQTVTYDATGLPTGLTINPATGLISGTPQSSGGTGAFLEQNGFVVIEMESADSLPNNWKTLADNPTSPNINDPGSATGGDFIVWEGGQSFNNQNNGLITYQVQITTPGTYQFLWRNQVGNGTNATEHNDTWLKIESDAFYAQSGGSVVCPKGQNTTENDCTGGLPEGSGGNGWFKVYSSGATNWSWSTNTYDNNPHQIYARFDQPGVYNILVSARSSSHLIDRMVLKNVNVSGNPQDLSLAESPRSAGGGTTVYDVTVIATDNGIPALSSDVAFTWNITEGVTTNTPPTVNLNGPVAVTVNVGEAYTDAGATAFDFEDGDLTGSIVTNGLPIDTSAVGQYTVTYTVTDSDNNVASASRSVTVVDPGAGPAVTSLVVVDAASDTELFTLSDNAQINVTTLPTSMSVRAITNGEEDTIESVVFSLSGDKAHNQTESGAPYALYGDSAGNYIGQSFGVGTYSIIATPYSGNSATGTPGIALSVTFSVTEGEAPNQAPNAVINVTNNNGLTTVESDTAFTFDLSAASSTDTDGTITAYSWDTGSNIDIETVEVQPDSSIVVNLTVTDDDGDIDTTSITLSVTPPVNDPPTAVISVLNNNGLTAVESDTAVIFDLSAASSSDPDNAIVGYDWSTGSEIDTTSVTVEPGSSAEVILTVTDEGGESDTVAITLTVTVPVNDPPSATITILNNNGQSTAVSATDYTFDLTAASSNDPDGTITSYAWDTGSAIVTESVTVTPGASTIVTVIVTDDGGETDTASLTLSVVEPAPGPALTALIVVDASTDSELFVLSDGAIYTQGELPTSMNVRAIANAEEDTVQSVVFALTGDKSFNQIESGAPYALFGDLGGRGDYLGENFGPGSYQIVATPYSGNSATGDVGAPFIINFSVVAENGASIIAPDVANAIEGVVSPRPTFNWDATITDGAWFNLVIVDANNDILVNTWVEGVESCGAGTCTWMPSDSALVDGLDAGTYTWWMRSWADDSYSGWLSGPAFTVTADSLGGESIPRPGR